MIFGAGFELTLKGRGPGNVVANRTSSSSELVPLLFSHRTFHLSIPVPYSIVFFFSSLSHSFLPPPSLSLFLPLLFTGSGECCRCSLCLVHSPERDFLVSKARPSPSKVLCPLLCPLPNSPRSSFDTDLLRREYCWY